MIQILIAIYIVKNEEHHFCVLCSFIVMFINFEMVLRAFQLGLKSFQ
jgi:hypothetical protein